MKLSFSVVSATTSSINCADSFYDRVIVLASSVMLRLPELPCALAVVCR